MATGRSLGTLTIDLIARTSGFTQGMDRASRKAKSSADEIWKSVERVRLATITLGAAAATAMGAWVVSMSKSMDAAGKMADQIGTTTEALTGLRYAAAQMANVSEGTFDMSLRRMTRRIAEAADGSGAAKAALESLGVSAKELAGLSVDEQFLRIADAIKGADSQGQRLRATMAVFDTEGMPLVNALSQGREEITKYVAEAERFGIVISSDAARAASDFQTSLSRLQAIMSGVGITLGNEVLPVISEFITRAIETSDEIDGVLTSAKDLRNDRSIPEWVDIAGSAFAHFMDVAVALAKTVGVVGMAFRAVAADAEVAVRAAQKAQVWNWFDEKSTQNLRDSLIRRNEIVGDFNEKLNSLITYQGDKNAKAWRESIEKLNFDRNFVGPTMPGGTLDPITVAGGGDKGKKKVDEGQRYIDSLKRQMESVSELTELEKLRIRMAEDGLKFATKAQEDQAVAYAQTIDFIREQEEAFKSMEATNREAERIFESLRTEEEAIRESYERRREIILESTIATAEEKAAALLRLEEETNEALIEASGSYWEKYLAAAEENLTNFDELAGNVIENFSRQFGNAFERMVFDAESLGDAARGMAEAMARSVVNALGQMAAQWLAYQAVQLLVGKTTQASAASSMTANAMATALQAGLAAFASTAAIPIVGPAMAPAAMGAALAVTTPLATAVSLTALSGMAHDGIDSVPQDGTWLLQKGERVTTAETSAKLDATLERINSDMRSSRTGNGTVVNVIEDPRRAGQVETRYEDDREIIDVVVADIHGDGRAARALEATYGLRRQGR